MIEERPPVEDIIIWDEVQKQNMLTEKSRHNALATLLPIETPITVEDIPILVNV